MGRRSQFQLEVVGIRLVPETALYSTQAVNSPESAVHLVGETIKDMDREMVCVINLKTDGIPINCNFASIGALNYSMAHPRELLKSSILSNAANMILLHNHPSGTLLPSKDDIRMTDRMKKITELIGIPLLDHIIVGGDNREYFSFREKGIIKNPCIHLTENYEHIDWKNAQIAEKGEDTREIYRGRT